MPVTLTLSDYLHTCFLTAEQFADACHLSGQALSRLLEYRLIPAPAYVVKESTSINSAAFGKLSGAAPIGDYFHPANTVWVDKAEQAVAQQGWATAHMMLEEQFKHHMTAALAELDKTLWRLTDSFSDNGSVIEEGLAQRLDTYWRYFLNGTFGLCVANPVSEKAIAWKEVLQEKLTVLSDNGSRREFTEAEVLNTLELIDAYADSAMPFSPVEYPVSSRKRLVDDFKGLLNKCVTISESK